ncbi:MAG: hypothetical protein PHI19_00720 [Clostridia bacterium]|nr:hypothetical protein [Clostridia bacterium]
MSYGNTIEREYTNQYAVIRGSDYTVGNLIEGSSDIVNFSFKIISEAHGLDTAKNVIFNPDGTVGSYDIVVTQPSNTNYTVALANPYKYKITPKNAKITISNNFLKKNYNGEPPVITDFSKVSTLAKTSVVFTFSRNTNDGRPLGDVGVYNFSVSSTDPNHSVYLAKSYQYTISKANVTVSLRTDNKVYDGTPIRLQYSNLNVSTFRGITPVIRSFTSNPIYDGETIIGYTNVADDYANFQSVMNQMVIKFSKNIEKVDNIIFTDMSLALLRVNETNSTLLEALDYLNNNSWVMQTPGSLSAAIDSINMARSYLNAISASAQLTANENNLYFAKEMIDDAYDLIEAENTYLAFLFYPVLTTGANELASNAGNYNFVIFQNDYNKQYDYNSTLLYKINPKEVFLGVNTYSKMYGTITSNPVLGDEDYYDYETEVLVNGTRVPMTLPNFDPEFTRANPENFNAGKYDIYYVESVLLDNNYVILQDKTNYTWEFSITPATLTLQIDDTGYGDDKVYYGTKISNTVVNKWSYVSGLSPLDEAAATVGGEISLEYLMIHILSVHSVNYSACKVLGYEGDTLLLGPDVIADMNSKPSAGEYQVEATGFTSSNYIFDILPGLLKISKADIFINTDYDGNVSRTYGEKLVLSFGGFQYDDYITISYSQTVGDYVYDMYLGEDGGSFTMPTFGYDPILNPLGSPFALTAPATNEGVYPIYFDWSQSQADSLNNYNLTGIYDEYGDHIPFGSIVLRAELSFSVADANDPTHYPNTVYGEVPEMLYIYSGFKNSETQATLGFTNPDCTSLKLRNVWDSRQLTLQDFSFTETALDILSNYTLVMDTNANLTVNKRKLYVHLDKPLSVRYNAGVNVTPYISQRLIELEVPNSNPTQYEYFYYVIGGQYGYWDIAFTNKPYAGAEEADAGLGNTDTPEDIFERYTVEEGYLTYDDDGKVETLYPFYNYMVKHNLVYEAKIGEDMTIQLDGLNFITTGENYDVVYDPTTLNVYGQLNSFIMEENIIVIEGDEINDLAVQAVYEDGTHYTYTIAELNALSNATVSTEPDSLTTILNKNDEVEITFSRTYHLTDFVDRDIVEDVVYQLRKDASFEVQFGDSQGSTVVTRKYDTVTSSNMATLSGYNYRSMRDTTGYTSGGMYYLNGPNAGYDYVDTTLRLVPTQAAHGFALYFGGGVIGGTSSLVFQGENGTYQIVMGSPSHAYAVNSGGIDLFDGYSHNIRIYFNKQYKMVYLFIDGYACSAISVEDFEFDENESSKQSIGFYGTQAWVRHLVTGYKGYYDRLATQVKVVENTPLTYYITSGTGKDLTMYDIMASSGVPEGIEAPDYTYQYYVNGLEVGGGVHTFTQGSHKVEMLIRDGANTVDSRTVPIYVTYASESASVSEIVEGSATLLYDNITQSNPATIRSYTPNATDPDLMDNETAEYHTYRLNGSNPDYTSISLSFKMQVARKADGEYRLTNAKTYVALWGNNTSRAPGYSAVSGYYGIGLSYEYNHVNNIQITQLHVTFGTTEYSEIITGFGGVPLDWLGGNEYTVQLYVDKQDSSHYGGAKVKVLLYNGSSLEYSKTVEQGTVFEDGSVSSDNINGLISASACKASIISRDTIIKVSRALYNAENKTKNDYLINGTYTQSGYNGITVDGNAQVHISTNLATHSVNKLGESSLRFRFTESAVAADVNLRFMLASTDANIASFNSVYVEYIGADQALYFYFVEDGTIYKKQFLANLNLVDGATHTIVATLNTNRKDADSTNNLDGLLASRADVSPKTVYYQTWAIMIDGQETQGIMPYYNATAYWIRNNGSNSIGQTPPSSGDTFMDNYIYCALELSNAPIYLYGLESRAKQTSEYLG